jgi:tetratricopeptide (TPR) repeat protein
VEIPFEYFPIHDDCLNYVQALLGMDQLNEAFYILARLNLTKLDEFGYREFSEASLDLAGKLIISNPKSAKTARALLQRVQIRDDSADHASYLRLANSLRDQGLYNEAITEYARLGPIVSRSVDSPHKTILQLWPTYCYIKLYETYSKYAARDKKYAAAAGKMFNTALQSIKKIDEEPPDRRTNEYSLYKLIRSLVRVQYARQYEAAGDKVKSAEYYRQSVLEVTEGIVTARVGLEWLPESLIMAAEAYENLELNEAARNVYKQVMIFYKSTKWEKQSQERMANLPPPA